MTQASRPQASHITSFPLPSDPGPYSADQWAQLFQILYTGDQQATQGPFIRYLNELAVTDNGTNAVYVDTGAGMVNGHVLISSEQETWVIPAGPAGSRQDRVVMVENNTNVEVTQTTAARPFLFPNDLGEYTATPGVPPYSARLAIVRGDDLNNLPGIDQTAALYMVELARYSINNVPAISSLIDYRDFCHFSSTIGERYDIARLSTITAVGTDYFDTDQNGVEMPDAVTSVGWSTWIVPTDFRANLKVRAIVLPQNSANIVLQNVFYWAECGQAMATHTLDTGNITIAVVNPNWNCILEQTISPVVAGDILRLGMSRWGGAAADTINGWVRSPGWFITYDANN